MPDAHSSPPHDAPWQVICLCADWCGTCREWRPQLVQEAARHPGVRFAWVRDPEGNLIEFHDRKTPVV